MKRRIIAWFCSVLLLLSSCGTQQKQPKDSLEQIPQENIVDSGKESSPNSAPQRQEDNLNQDDTPLKEKAVEGDSKKEVESQKTDMKKEPTAPGVSKEAPKEVAKNPGRKTQAEEQQKPIVPTKPSPPKKETPKSQQVMLSVRGSEQIGMILSAISVDWKEGDTSFSVLKRTLKAKGIPMEWNGSGTSVYVEGIANLYEFDEGATSGWMYRVNGEVVAKSAGACKLQPGDQVEWIYTVNMGKDLN